MASRSSSISWCKTEENCYFLYKMVSKLFRGAARIADESALERSFKDGSNELSMDLLAVTV